MKTLIGSLSLSVVLLCSCSHPSDSDATGFTSHVADYMPRSMKEKNPHDVQFAIEKCVPLCELCTGIKNKTPNPANVNAYHFKISNLPEGVEFLILDRYKKPTFAPMQERGGVLFFKDGPFSVADIPAIVYGAGKGESFDYYLVAKDLSTCVRATAIPDPIEASGADGATLFAILLDLNRAKLFFIEGKNFSPHERVTIISTSYDEVLVNETTLSESGQFLMTISPAVIGKKGGIAKFEMIRQNERLVLEIPWGQESIKGRGENEPFVDLSYTSM